MSVGPLVAAAPPVTREDTREEARRELSKSLYDEAEPGWFSRLIEWINDKIADFFDWLTPDPGDGGIGGFNGLGALTLLIAILVVVFVVRMWLGPVRRTARTDGDDVGLHSTLSSAALREQAEEFARRGAYADAVRARLRAAVRMLEEKGVLDPRPGRTAGEIVNEVARTAPQAAEPLREAVTVFSEIWYGGRPATQASYEALTRADEALATLQRPSRSGSGSDEPSFTVPA